MSFAPFKITRLEAHGEGELISRLREVTLLEDRAVRPYAGANLTLRRLPYDEFRPTQRYVLSDNLERVRCLEWALAGYHLHPLLLGGYLTIWTDQSEEPIDLLPPIVEAMPEGNGATVNVINDGMHRLYAGLLEWRIPTVVLAQNIPPEYPYYAYPIPGSNPWDQVTILEGGTIPAGVIKKWYRRPDRHKLYRDFNSAFQNVGGPRGQG